MLKEPGIPYLYSTPGIPAERGCVPNPSGNPSRPRREAARLPAKPRHGRSRRSGACDRSLKRGGTDRGQDPMGCSCPRLEGHLLSLVGSRGRTTGLRESAGVPASACLRHGLFPAAWRRSVSRLGDILWAGLPTGLLTAVAYNERTFSLVKEYVPYRESSNLMQPR